MSDWEKDWESFGGYTMFEPQLTDEEIDEIAQGILNRMFEKERRR